MRKTLSALIATGTAGLLGLYVAAPGPIAVAAPTPVPASHADATHPAVIELFQSQGCSSCPPALAVLEQEANRTDVLALNFAVTYWDQLGWKDIYAQPAFTARQWAYSRAQGRSNVQTPQLIVNGRAAVLGSVKGDVDKAVAANARMGGPAISANGDRVTLSAAPGKPATVWFVTYDPRTIQVPIRAGENSGRTLPHRNIVKQLTAVGDWNGVAASYTLPATAPGLARAVLVQSGRAGPIVAAARI